MSGYTDDSILRNGLLEPGTRLVGKPFSAAGLTRKVRKALDEERGGIEREAREPEAGR